MRHAVRSPVVREHLDDSAIGDATTAAAANHALKFCLERFQPIDAALNLLKLALCNTVCGLAGLFRVIRQGEELADRIQRKS